MNGESIAAHFREQAQFCSEYGSPFTSQLCERFASDFEAGGPVAALTAGWTTNPRADALALRLAGALHAAALTNRSPQLAAQYPSAAPGWTMEAVWPHARAYFENEFEWVRDFIRSPPQTNETRRSIALLAGFLAFAETWDGPIDILEIGASAGLNLNWDQFAYRTAQWVWGGASPVNIDTVWHGAPPEIEARPRIRSRAACDLNPLDVRQPQDRLRLKSYIWPDQPDRLARFDGAAALAIANDIRVDRASADVWLDAKLSARARDAATIIYHSVFMQYPPAPIRRAIVDRIHAAGAEAQAAAPLVWVRLEPELVTDGVENGFRFVIDMHSWPSGERRIVGFTDGHVRAVYSA